MYKLIFDKIILKQLKKLENKKDLKNILNNMFNKLEIYGPIIGKLLDSKLSLYEIKNKNPSIRLYYKVLKNNIEIYVFEFEIKKSNKKQQNLINILKKKLRKRF